MTRLATRLLPPWPILALAASLAMLAVAHGFERIGGLEPCMLCFKQRQIYWGAALVAVLGLAATRVWTGHTVKRAVAVLLGLAFVTGAIVALYHVAVEQKWLTATCDVGGGRIPTFDVNATFSVPQCDEIQWQWLGISMAGWNALASILLASASFLVAASPGPQPAEDA